MNTQLESQKDENGGSKSHKDEKEGFENLNGTSTANADPAESFSSTVEDNQILSLVEWLNFIVPYLRLPLDATEEELRACLIDGTVLCRILNKLCPGSVEMGGSSDPGFANVKRFLVAVDELGFPRFDLIDLEQGSLVPVLQCLGALKSSFDFGFWGENSKHLTRTGSDLLEIESLKGIDRSRGDISKFGQQCTQNREETQGNSVDSTSQVTDPSADLVHHIGQQLKQGTFVDFSDAKILESIKSTSLDNASTRSLFNVGHKILDDSIDRNNGDVPHRVAYLLKKVMQVTEQRFANQAVNLRIQNNIYKAREEKYLLKIKVLETLTSGTAEENEVVLKQLQNIKLEKFDIEEQKKLEEEDAVRLKEEKDRRDSQISTLKQELEMATSRHESYCHKLEANAKEAKLQLERKLKELECILTDSKKNQKELEASLENESRRWKNKERTYQSCVTCQSRALQELSATLESTRREILKTKGSYSEEFNYLGLKLKELTDAAEKYHAVLDENRKLYNEVQDLKGNIRVYCRIRPFLRGQSQRETTIEYIGENGDLVIANPSKQGKDSRRLFKFNKVFGPAATQADVFLDTQPLIRSVLDGYNVCIFAYGQTGSGKTYTMSGPSVSSTDDWGINYRALNDLFQISQSRKSSIAYEVGVQMVEIYNEQVRDLLSSEGPQKRLGIWNTTQPNGLAVPEASMHPVNSTADVLKLMNIGLMNRAVGATALNERSSRSHSVLTVHVCGVDLKSDTSLRGSLHLVDLAGSERVDRSEATGDRLREAQHINKSLSALGDVIFALAQKSSHVPYRNSKLTQVLQSSLGGQAKTLMFVQLNPDVESFAQTISTLKFAERVSGVELGAARSNKEGRYVRELMEQVASFRDTIAKKDEEIERLLRVNSNGLHRGMSSLRYASSSPRRHSIGSPRLSQKSPGRRGSGYYSDKRSEVSSQLSTDDFRNRREDFPRSKNGGEANDSEGSSQSMDDFRHHKEHMPQSKHEGEAKHSEDSSQQSADNFRDNKEHSPRLKQRGETKNSEAGSDKSLDDFRNHKGHSTQPKYGGGGKHSEGSSEQSIDDFRHHKEHSTQQKRGDESSQNITEDFELVGFGEEDSGERLSDISDGGLSMGTETEGSMASFMEFTLFPDVTKPTESTNAGNTEVMKTQTENAQGEKTPSQRTVRFAPSKLPKPSPKLAETKATRTSVIRSSSKVLPSPWKSTAGSSSSVRSSKRWH
ncbi:kinesin-like protein KIN-14J [Pyrus x bretschneideri]|uniref:kinesin-like protein KIN-14J n=1 Tax=Pyrus x bretschneideri TaxID=225117 RepID=UPI002030D175|nr:kinesin-like protein KIN-14J [Pyrus x bretschneideri]XP_048446085.1 kinesin-like protein KIN-14J [Pyrus x bretschneideri]XP_048446086.1 kinesin-like protein KIN-14J [Pyrus x bretschneideri]